MKTGRVLDCTGVEFVCDGDGPDAKRNRRALERLMVLTGIDNRRGARASAADIDSFVLVVKPSDKLTREIRGARRGTSKNKTRAR